MMELDAKRLKALDELLDREEIRKCLLRYSRGVDRHDAATVASAFHVDALDEHGQHVWLGSEMCKTVNAIHDDLWEAHMHFITNISIELDGDSAHVETYEITVGRRKQNAATDIHAGRYIDRFAKRDGRWGIAARRYVYEWGLPAENAAAQLKIFNLGVQDSSDVSYIRPLNVTRERNVF